MVRVWCGVLGWGGLLRAVNVCVCSYVSVCVSGCVYGCVRMCLYVCAYVLCPYVCPHEIAYSQ